MRGVVVVVFVVVFAVVVVVFAVVVVDVVVVDVVVVVDRDIPKIVTFRFLAGFLRTKRILKIFDPR